MSQPLAPLELTIPIETIDSAASIPLDDNNLFSYEWNIFEQSLEWAHQDSLDWLSTESVLSTSPSLPGDSSFSPQPQSQSQALSNDQSLSNLTTSPTSNPKLLLPKDLAAKKLKPHRRQQSPESRARRRSQNREAQRAFRCRKQQHLEEIEIELRTMASKYEGLQEKYKNLSKLYMDLLRQRGGEVEHGPALVDIEGVGESFLPDWRTESEEIAEGIGMRRWGRSLILMSCFLGRAWLLVQKRLENARLIWRCHWITDLCWGRFLGVAMNLFVGGVP